MERKTDLGFVDIHTHILPGVDDGALNMDEALELTRMAWENGTAHLVLTPHYRGRWCKNTPQLLRRQFEQLEAVVKEALPGMTLYLGNEAAMERELGDKVAEGRVLPLHNSHYVLLEFDYNSSRIQMVDGVMGVIGSGYTPVIAHAERYRIIQKDKKLAGDLLEVGALIQLNSDSVMGKCGLGIKWTCRRLLKNGMVQFIASDAHDPKDRPPLLKECYEYVCGRYDEDYANALFRENALALLSGKWR
jgi:protein-tyrosine phosphatase